MKSVSKLVELATPEKPGKLGFGKKVWLQKNELAYPAEMCGNLLFFQW